MASIKFRSNIAEIEESKTSEVYIDSGATRHFFHSRFSFIAYERMKMNLWKEQREHLILFVEEQSKYQLVLE